MVSEPTCRALCYSGASVLAMSEPAYRALCYSDADCFSRVFEQCQLLLHQQVRGAELDTVLLLF